MTLFCFEIVSTLFDIFYFAELVYYESVKRCRQLCRVHSHGCL